MRRSFSIEPENMNRHYQELETAQKSIEEIGKEISSIRNHLLVSGRGVSGVKKSLGAEKDQLRDIGQEIYRMKEGLETIVREYRLAELKISGNPGKLKLFGEYAQDFISDMIEGVRDYFEDLKEECRERESNVVFRIKDEETRNGFNESYREILQRLYDEVPAEYRDARSVYDKYSRDVVVADFHAEDDDGEPTAYHRGGKLYINSHADVDNKRGNGTTYYHEYGHFVVYKEGLIKGKKCQGDFKRFEDSLRSEITSYYEKYEQQYREEGIAKGYKGKQLEKHWERQTVAAINKDINGPSGENIHINNGISDIIDGVSNGKYQPYYGHGDTYWDENPSRVANEAFAQIFSAQMTGDTAEIEKMKQIMPETYGIYSKMIKNMAEQQPD